MNIPSLSISVDEIPDAGWVLRCDLPIEWLGDSILPIYTATSPLSVDSVARRMGDNVHVEARLGVELTFLCSRTAAPGETTVTVELHELFERGESLALNLMDGVDSDEIDGDEPYLIKDGKVDLEPLFREQLVLAQEPWPVVEPVEDEDAAESPLWSSGGPDVDPRWAKLKDIKLG